MDTKSDSKSWWLTLPGILTAVAGTVTAITGLIVALHQTGVLSAKKQVSPPENIAGATPTEANPVFPKGTILKTASGAALTLESQLHARFNRNPFFGQNSL